MEIPTDANILAKTKDTVTSYYDGYLESDLNYRFRTREFLNVVFLYKNSVDVRNPDILGANNKNTFVYEPASAIAKIKEQIRLDIKDINFTLNGASSLATFVVKAANRKMLNDSNFEEEMDRVPDDAADYGSGFLKVWETDGELKMKAIDPFDMIFNQYDFAGGLKIEKFRKSYRWVLGNEKYDQAARDVLSGKVQEDELDNGVNLYAAVQDFEDGTQHLFVVALDDEVVLYKHKSKKAVVDYFKFDYEKRRGFPDALGIGCNERVFNKMVQSKVNRERMDKVMEIAAKLPFQKQLDNELDNTVGKNVVKLDTGVILGHKGNPIQQLDTGGIKQANLIMGQLNSIIQTIGADLNVGEALQGNTLPSGTSGVLGNLLTENASSVLKEVKKNYAKFLNHVYDVRGNKYIVKAFGSKENLREHLEPNDIKLVELSVINYLVVQKQINAAINDLPYNEAQARDEARRQVKRNIIPAELLDSLREEVQGIRTYISGENISKAQTVAFIRELRQTIAQAPQLLSDPRFVTLIKKEAELDAGLSGVEIDNILRELPAQPAQPLTPEPNA